MRLCTRGHFGDHEPLLRHHLMQRAVPGRIRNVHAGAKHGYGSTPGPKGAAVRRCVHAARQAADHRHAGGGEGLAQPVGNALAVGGAVTRADDGDEAVGGAQQVLAAEEVELIRRIGEIV